MPRADSQPFPKEASSEIKLGLRKKCFLRSRNVLDQIRSPICEKTLKPLQGCIANIASFAYPEQKQLPENPSQFLQH